MGWRISFAAIGSVVVGMVVWSLAGYGPEAAAQRAAPAIAVTTAAVEVTPPRTRLQSIGTGKAIRSVVVTADVAGTVEAVHVEPNITVEAGAPIVTLERKSQEIALAGATAELNRQEAAFARYQALIDQASSSVSEAAFDEVRAARALAEAQVDAAQYDYDRRAIRAPFAGRINLNDLTVGSYLPQGAAVVTLIDASRLLVEFSVTEAAVADITVGLPVRLFTPALRGLLFDGEVVAFDSAIDAELRTIRVRAEVQNTDYTLLPGMTFSVTIGIGDDPLPVVPAVSILWNRDGAYVWRLDGDDALEAVPVIFRHRQGDRVWVEADLAAGDRIIMDGAFKLNAESEVNVLSGEGADG
ncbi:MAG: efflux RND transporter periplasmic adaptor subunit [Hyphomicrobiales bacterium]|nr:efflux RND transporter periplasmic adaptor subunit [Hyphomicrobiales bacterium]